MKNSISDLLDSMEYSPLKTKAADIISAERVKEITLSRLIDNTIAAPKAIRRFRPLAVALIAAVLAIALCSAAYAANLFSIREILGNKFMASGTELNKSDIDILEEVGAIETPAFISEGTSITVTAAVYDGSHYYLALSVIAPEGTILDRGDSFWQIWGDLPEEMISITLPSGAELDHEASVMFNDDIPGDNEITIVLQILSHGGVFGDGDSKVLSIHGLWLQSPDKEYTKVLDGEWSFDLEALGINGAVPGVEADNNESGGLDPISGEPKPMGE